VKRQIIQNNGRCHKGGYHSQRAAVQIRMFLSVMSFIQYNNISNII
jgi:hypothetical protein